MSEYKVKLAAALPKGEGNGFADYTIAGALAATVTEGRSVQPRVALLVYDVKKVEVDPDGIETVHLRMRRVQPVVTIEGRRQAEQMLADEFAAQTGQAMPPYDLSALSKSAFADLPRTTEEIDEKESREQDLMSPTDELRRHLERVHGAEGAHLLTAEAAEEKHRADHDGDALGPLAHEPDWFGWTRADLEAAEFEADGVPANDEVDYTTPDGRINAIPANVDEHLDGAGTVHPVDPWAEDESEPAETNVVRAEDSMQADADTEATLFSDAPR